MATTGQTTMATTGQTDPAQFASAKNDTLAQVQEDAQDLIGEDPNPRHWNVAKVEQVYQLLVRLVRVKS